ncbi:permease prefix domain 1-containing protein [Nonomuraea wenchangensis]|uniref:permease prefix domain 1-containing protein n=1 Tax=Nonomuraea wenchangensis TaxID=568860 RepID=UPI00378D2965
MTTTATTNTLTDRYVAAVLRHLPGSRRSGSRRPEDQRPDIDIERELRASIADAVDDRVEAGADRAEAEFAVLTELGDPARLAAGYADRPLQLIGPALYLDYTRLLTALLVTIVPAVAVAVGLVQGLRGAGALDLIGDTLGAALTTAAHLVCWTTLLFATIERAAGRRTPARRWTPDALPEPPTRRARYGELIIYTVAMVLFTTLILLSPVISTETDAHGAPIGVFAPWLWQTGFVYAFIALVTLNLAVAYAKHYARWSVPLAVAGTLVEIACPIALLWLAAGDRVLNPGFTQAAAWPQSATTWINTALIVVSALTIVFAVIDGIARATRH